MTQPPQDALDLYAFGVQYCEERGIPFSSIRVHWEVDLANRDGWQFNGEGWHPQRWSRYTDGPKEYPLGFYLCFSYGQGRAYGLEGINRWDGQEVVWVNPGHEFLLLRRPEPTMSGENVCPARCRICDLLTGFSYPHGWSFSKDYQREKKEHFSPPPNIQLPACIKRHRLTQIWSPGHNPPQFHGYVTGFICSDCGQRWPAPERSGRINIRNPDYIKSLGRCPGAP